MKWQFLRRQLGLPLFELFIVLAFCFAMLGSVVTRWF